MRLYSCKVRLSGSLYNEVAKDDITAPEVTILRTLHGDDAIVGLVETGKNKIGQAQERDRLLEIYGGGLVAVQLAKTPEAALAAIFGVTGRLPDDIPGTPKAVAPKAAALVAEPEAEEDDPPTEDPEE